MVLKTRYLERIRYLNGDFETAVYELKTYFGFFRLQRTWETILHFYTYDGTTPIMSDGGLQGDSPEFMVFCLVTLHLWGHIFSKFPEIKVLAYTDDGNIIAKLSTDLKPMSILTPFFKEDANPFSKKIERCRKTCNSRKNTHTIHQHYHP